jgi:hypothetical protein
VIVSDLSGTSNFGSVFQCGDNSSTTQGAVDLEPQRIIFSNVHVPTHRNKRAFEINCSATLLNSSALDVYIAGQDSQGIAILNTCGPVVVTGGTYVAASENIMVGGDTMKMPCTTSNVQISGVTLTKPNEWRGVVTVKNLLEFKRCVNCTVRDSYLANCWSSGQEGIGIVITPKNNQYIQNIEFDNVTVEHVALGVQFLGWDYNSVTPQATSGIAFKNSHFSMSKAENGGRGILALYSGGMLDSTWENIDATFDGSAIVVADSQIPQGPFTIRNSRMPTGAYGVQAPGANYGNVGYAGRELITVFEGNVFDLSRMGSSGQTQFKANFPNNTWQ